jgi:hypothetical protein
MRTFASSVNDVFAVGEMARAVGSAVAEVLVVCLGVLRDGPMRTFLQDTVFCSDVSLNSC